MPVGIAGLVGEEVLVLVGEVGCLLGNEVFRGSDGRLLRLVNGHANSVTG